MSNFTNNNNSVPVNESLLPDAGRVMSGTHDVVGVGQPARLHVLAPALRQAGVVGGRADTRLS